VIQIKRGVQVFLNIFSTHTDSRDVAEPYSYAYPQKISRTKLILGILVFFLALNVADCFLTMTLVQNGAGWEGNIIWSYIPIWYKLILASVVGIMVASYRVRLLMLLNVGMIAIVMWNLTIWGCYELS